MLRDASRSPFFDTRLFVFFGDLMNFENDASDMEASNAISAIRSSQTQSQSDARMNLAFFKFEGSIG